MAKYQRNHMSKFIALAGVRGNNDFVSPLEKKMAETSSAFFILRWLKEMETERKGIFSCDVGVISGWELVQTSLTLN